LEAEVDFVLAFAMVHEVPDQRRLLEDVRNCLRPGGQLFIAEPRGHVPPADFQQTVDIAEGFGLKLSEQPHVRWCRAAVFIKPPADAAPGNGTM
jgi:SAM-dependent methyltransferase